MWDDDQKLDAAGCLFPLFVVEALDLVVAKECLVG